jgi:hypothetical protein
MIRSLEESRMEYGRKGRGETGNRAEKSVATVQFSPRTLWGPSPRFGIGRARP